DGHHLETVPLEKLTGADAEQIQMTRAARVRGFARRRQQRAADSAPAHRFIHVQRAYQRRVDLRLYANHSDRRIADIRNDVTRGRPLNSVGHQAAARQHRPHHPEIASLLDYKFTCAMIAYRQEESDTYFFGGGKS